MEEENKTCEINSKLQLIYLYSNANKYSKIFTII